MRRAKAALRRSPSIPPVGNNDVQTPKTEWNHGHPKKARWSAFGSARKRAFASRLSRRHCICFASVATRTHASMISCKF